MYFILTVNFINNNITDQVRVLNSEYKTRVHNYTNIHFKITKQIESARTNKANYQTLL